MKTRILHYPLKSGIRSTPEFAKKGLAQYALIEQHKDRVLVGISLTGTVDKEQVVAAVEPCASSISQRTEAMREAHRLGLRTYGMLCPLLPGIANEPDEIDELVRFVKSCGVEEVFCEAVNPRGPGLRLTDEALREKGFMKEAGAVFSIRCRTKWSPYVGKLISDVQAAMRKHLTINMLRFLLYPSGLRKAELDDIEKDDGGVVWL
jgi:DNA repair photolyase